MAGEELLSWSYTVTQQERMGPVSYTTAPNFIFTFISFTIMKQNMKANLAEYFSNSANIFPSFLLHTIN
jgi:hypothetical protein